jgi:RNA polymerase sigma factor (sigma-70 family)
LSSASAWALAPELRRELDTLFVRLADGERGAIDPAYRVLWPALRAFVGRALGPAREHEADDVTQASLLKLFAQASRYDPARDAYAWALALTSWELRSAQTRARRDRSAPLDTALDLASGQASPEDAALHASELSHLRDAIALLPPADREVIEQVLAESHPSDATFRKRRERAMARLRAFLKEVHGT